MVVQCLLGGGVWREAARQVERVAVFPSRHGLIIRQTARPRPDYCPLTISAHLHMPVPPGQLAQLAGSNLPAHDHFHLTYLGRAPPISQKLLYVMVVSNHQLRL